MSQIIHSMLLFKLFNALLLQLIDAVTVLKSKPKQRF